MSDEPLFTELGNNTLLIHHAGYGVTPPCPKAKFKVGDVVKVRRLKHLRDLPDRAAIAIVVPPGFPAEYAHADALQKPRPLMVTKPLRGVSYIVAFDNDPRPMHLRESYLVTSGEPPVEVKWSAPQ